MIRYFKSHEDDIIEEFTPTEGSWIALTNPTAAEIKQVSTLYNIDMDDLKAPLDEEERSRVEIEENYTMVLVDIPVIESRNDKDWYVTIPMGIIMARGIIITVCLQDNPVLDSFMEGRVRHFNTAWRTRFILQILYKNASWYLHYLRLIDKRSEELEQNLQSSMKNEKLVELLELEKSLVYFRTSLRSNEMVLEKLMKSERIKKFPEDEELLEDVIIENKQAMEMASIYSGILSGMMDAFSSIISNNLNIVMKFLASVTIVMSIPTIIGGYYGMNVNEAGMPFAGSEYGFAIVILLSIVISLIVAAIFQKFKLF
ncbi:Magnesium and cobalt transport protein CorA [Lachnospiraceae bacterium TWA4]|nr:Magnesium and cobalt transport protein CorA [Lachnospiraceae bacterium TWA4]